MATPSKLSNQGQAKFTIFPLISSHFQTKKSNTKNQRTRLINNHDPQQRYMIYYHNHAGLEHLSLMYGFLVPFLFTLVWWILSEQVFKYAPGFAVNSPTPCLRCSRLSVQSKPQFLNKFPLNIRHFANRRTWLALNLSHSPSTSIQTSHQTHRNMLNQRLGS